MRITEKVSMAHPDKIADRISGALVDYCYSKQENPKCAFEVLIGHNACFITGETSVSIPKDFVKDTAERISGVKLDTFNYVEVPQDIHLANNQKELRCGDNGVFAGYIMPDIHKEAYSICHKLYNKYPTDGKIVLNGDTKELTICWSNADDKDIKALVPNATLINPLGSWTGGVNVDTGVTGRKLASDFYGIEFPLGGGSMCFSWDTEFLSDDMRWHYIKDYKKGQKVAQYNNGKLEFVIPQRYIENTEGDLIGFKNESKLSMVLTPDHQILLKTSKGHFIKKDAAFIANKIEKNVGNSGEIIHSFEYDSSSTKSYYSDYEDFCLQIAFCADGTILDTKHWNGRIRVKKGYKKERLRKLLSKKDYKETQDGDYSIFWYNFPKKNKSLYECFKDEDMSRVYQEIYKWDGDQKTKCFRTTIKQDADFVQLVISSQGKVASIKCDNRIGKLYSGGYTRKSMCYTVSELKTCTTSIRKLSNRSLKVYHTRGKSYCFTVPSHNLIMRHKNRIFVSGNCGKDVSKADVSVNVYCFLKAQVEGKEQKAICSIGDKSVNINGVLTPFDQIVSVSLKAIKAVGGFEKFMEWGLVSLTSIHNPLQ